ACAVATECASPLAPVCQSGRCGPCAGDAVCAAQHPERPHCAQDGSCQVCVNSQHCSSAATPICHSDSGGAGMCEACAGAAECATRDATRPLCSPSGACVACVTSVDCPVESAPVCADGACRGCQDGAECRARNGTRGGACDLGSGSCVECVEAN